MGLGPAPLGAAQRLRGRRRRFAVLASAVLAVIACTALARLPTWQLFEARLYDLVSTTRPWALLPAGPDIVVVAVDEPSFSELDLQWPWPRDLHAKLIRSLRAAGARVIALDMVFAEPSTPAADMALAAATGPDVVLAADEDRLDTPQASQALRVEPLAELTVSGARVGLASVSLDRDGVLRTLPPYPDSFGRAILAAAGLPVPENGETLLTQAFGPARTYPTVSYYQALEPDRYLPAGFFRGRIVVVGLSLHTAPTTQSGGSDAFATPFTAWTGRLVPGAEIQATAADNLRRGLGVRPASWAQATGAVALAAALAALCIGRRTRYRTVGIVAGLIVLVLAASVLLQWTGVLWLPPAGPVLAIAFTLAPAGFYDFVVERRLRQGVVRAFSHYVSPEVVHRLAEDPEGLKLGGERRTLTLLFCDVRGFTTLAETMKDDPERLTRLINRLMNPLSAVVLHYGGTIDKYMGDCIMAFWNAPLDDPAHARHAVEAGLAMLDAVEVLNVELAAEAEPGANVPRLAIGVGLNTGDCLVGNMGSDLRFDYTAIGDAVNLASRLEGLSKSYGVALIVGEETARRVPDCPFVELDRVAARGRAALTSIYTVGAGEEPSSNLAAVHAGLVDDLCAGRLQPGDARPARLAEARPWLAGYYAAVAARVG